MIRLVLLGGPGSGKGTQADVLKEKYNVVKLSTGDLLRQEIRKDSELGKRAKSFMDKGELVPDSVMIDILDKITTDFEEKKQGYILDGFPRTIPQADALLEVLDKQGVALTMALLIDVPKEELVRRLSSRWTCRNCSATTFKEPNGNPVVCPQCGGELYQRDDDKRETILNRMEVYKKNTQPLITFFEKKGLLEEVDGFGSFEEISGRIIDLFNKKSIE
ncbi:MAG: adenylate kinase [Candidatus Marinimicrobia bacterium]|nr:adenylate kinase [Candidatus Neomarinimicrobiota bacterium]